MNRLFVTFSLIAAACSTPKTASEETYLDNVCGDLARAICECGADENPLEYSCEDAVDWMNVLDGHIDDGNTAEIETYEQTCGRLLDTFEELGLSLIHI